MRRRRNPKARVEEEEEDEERLGNAKEEKNGDAGWNSFIKSVNTDDDDDEANEDLSLKIVEKSLQMRSAKRNPREEAMDMSMSNGAGGSGAVDFCGGSSNTEAEVVEQASGVALVDEIVGSEVDSSKRKRKKKLKKVEAVEERTEVAEGEKMDGAGQSQAADKIDSADKKTAEIIDNSVLRKLLRGPRYFDPPDSGWGTCFNCGEEGHAAINCTSARRKKPCFVCGSLDHNAKQCSKGQDCFICKKGGHRAKDCPERGKSGSEFPRVCLKCGYHGHDMFSCNNDYSSEDMKEIQCYVCNKFGHLCCFNTSDTGSRELSCYKCGQLGHTGLACSRVRGEATDPGSLTLCYRCGEEGHFARECPNSSKVAKRRREPSTPRTPTWGLHREGKDKKASRSAPNNIGKSLKKKKIQSEDKGLTTPRKSKHRGGWMAEHPGDYSPVRSKKNKWKSPASPSTNSAGWSGRRHTGSQSPSGWKYHSRTQVAYGSPNDFHHHGYATQAPVNGFHDRNQGPANDFHDRNFVRHQSSSASHKRNSVPRWSGHGDYHTNSRQNYRLPATRFDHNYNETRSNYSWW